MTRIVLGFDVGGSSVKAGLVDVDGGRMVGDLISAPTPQPATPQAVMTVIAALAARLNMHDPHVYAVVRLPEPKPQSAPHCLAFLGAVSDWQSRVPAAERTSPAKKANPDGKPR